MNTDEKTSVTKVHFIIDFAGMTRHIRDLWAEGSYWKCVNTIDAMGVPREYWPDVIEGRKKLAQDPKGRKGVDGVLRKDSWKPNPANCHWGRYPKFEELTKMFEQQKQWAEKYLDIAYMEAGRLWREFERTRFNGNRLAEIILLLKAYPREVLELASVDMKRFDWEWDNRDDFNPVAGKFEIDLGEYLDRQVELQSAPKPKPDNKFSHPTGCIAPDGKFYTCGWMEHSWLVYEVAGLTKEQADKTGWITITHPLGQPDQLKVYWGERPLTQAQRNTLFDWQQKYPGAEIINGGAGEWGTTDDEDKEI